MSQLSPSSFNSPVNPLQPRQPAFPSKKARAIGFLGQDSSAPSGSPEIAPEDILLQFDSGRAISFDDAMHHCLFLGTTGSGKTASAVLPVLDRLIGAGGYGMLPDIKGNLTPYVCAQAEKHGRLGDILEFGTSDTAVPMNLLADMDSQRLRAFFEKLTMDNFKGATQSRDWHMKGVSQAADCGQLLLFMQEQYKDLAVSCRLISEMIHNPVEAQKVYAFFMKKIFDPTRADHKAFNAAIENNRFHLLKKQDNTSGSAGVTLDEQLSWSLQGVRDGLRAFLEAPGVERNFCRPGAMGLELRPAIMANKIIILRFDLDTGPVAAMISRMILSHFYACVFNIGLDLPKDRRGFVCIDEFQEMADLGNGRFSDTAFVALGREFRCEFLGATQSMSALAARGDDPAAVSAFVSNCNQKVIFFSDDPLTQELVSRYDPEMNLTALESGEAYAITYDSRNRRHEAGLETLHGAYESVKDILANAKPVAMPAREPEPERHLLQELVEWTEREIKGQGRKVAVAEAEKRHMPRVVDPAPPMEDDRVWERKRRKRWDEGLEDIGRRKEEDDMDKIAHEAMPVKKAQPGEGLMVEFPDLFAEGAKVCVPAGWIPQIGKALRAFQATGMHAEIEALVIDGWKPRAALAGDRPSRGYELGGDILNRLLLPAGYLCVVCGKPHAGFENDSIPLCKGCQEKYGVGMGKVRPRRQGGSRWGDDD